MESYCKYVVKRKAMKAILLVEQLTTDSRVTPEYRLASSVYTGHASSDRTV